MTFEQKKIIIAIDGFSSCGKSTVAKGLAEKLHFLYIDSGAMYRATTLYCLENNIIINGVVNEEKLNKSLDNIHIEFISDKGAGTYFTFLNGKNIEDDIRNIEVSNNVSNISIFKKVREKMVALQRAYAIENSIVMDGRDIGTVVFPNADLKIFMTADVKIRATRRYNELLQKGQKVSLQEIEKNIMDRDEKDQTRAISPLKKANDAIVLDNSYLTHEEQLNWVIAKVNSIINN
ncbi:MAG: (d)CMP kinase [Chlorobi bacterium]|nr:(d)CMP kinase [Chlorobiota bacterium]